MNVAELERLVADMEEFHDGASITTDAGTLRTLARRVIAAEKLVEAATKFMAAYHSGKNIHGHSDNIDNVLKNINSDRECF